MIEELVNDNEVVTEYEKWKVSQIDTATLYQILAQHMADERKESGDHSTAIQLYTDILAYQTQQTPDQTVARQSDLCLVLHNRAVCYLSTEQYTLCIKVRL